MIFGIIISVICCGLILAGLVMITRNSIGKKPELIDRITYIIAPYGLAICLYYYIFFWKNVDIAMAFSGLGNFNVFADILINIILPAAILSFLFISFQAVRNIGWRVFTITLLAFFLLAWLNIIWKTIDYNQSFGSAARPGFPIVQWSSAVFIALLVIAVFERRRKGERPSVPEEDKPSQ